MSAAQVINGNLDEMRDAIAEFRRSKEQQFGGAAFFSNITFGKPTPQKPGHPLGNCVKYTDLACNGPNGMGGCAHCDTAAWQTVSFATFKQVP